MTLCNMSIEGGARVGYVNPDRTTFDYLRGRQFAPQGDAFDRATTWWASMASDPGAAYDAEALAFMGFRAGQRVQGTKIDVAFVGSCTNARLSDLREAARVVRGHH